MAFWSTWLGFGNIRASDEERDAALARGRIEAGEGPDDAPTMVASGRQTKGALPVTSETLDGAVYSSKGKGYARYNEDAAALFLDTEGRMYAMALDQAGGLGGKVRGEASGLAAAKLWEACRDIAGGHDEIPRRLTGAILEAHEALLARSQGEVTTAVVAVVDNDNVRIVNSGDSGAVHFSADGQLVERTEMHEFGFPNQGCLKHALGLEPEGCMPTPYEWTLGAGEWLVLGSDGLLDSGLVEEELGGILRDATSAEDAVNRACTIILRRMGRLVAKPDNLTVVAIHRRDR